MSPEPLPLARSSSDPTAEAAFKDWVRRIVKGAAELQAFEAGQIDAVMDSATGSAILLPEAQAALQGSSRLVLSALEALPGEVCVLDAVGTVVMTNKAWRAFGAARAGAGLSVREGGNFFAACRDAAASTRDSRRRGAAGGAGRGAQTISSRVCMPPCGRALCVHVYHHRYCRSRHGARPRYA
jgi:hypothetical protein